MKASVKIVFILALLVCSSAHAASEQDELAFMRQTMQELIRAGKKGQANDEKAVQRFADLVEMDLLTQKTVTDFRQELTAEKYDAFRKLFSETMRKLMVKKARNLRGRSLRSLRYSIQSKNAAETEVRVEAQTDKKAITMEYTLARVGNQWRIVDVSVEGALLSRNYRGQFNRIYREEGFDGLYSRLNKKLTES
jgi:phospholipid transport system substrate-binding protein